MPLESEHPFIAGFKPILESQLSISNNLEDESKSEIYWCSIQILNLLLDTLDKHRAVVLISVLKFDPMIKTIVNIQESVLKGIQDKLSKNILCAFCTTQCTFFKCSEKKVAVYEKRLADIGFHTFVFILKARQILGKELLPDSNHFMNLNKGTTYLSHLTSMLKIINKQIRRFDDFFSVVNKKMLQRNETPKETKKVKEEKKVVQKSKVLIFSSAGRRRLKCPTFEPEEQL